MPTRTRLCQYPGMPALMLILIATLLALGCASGPHPATTVAAKDFDCPIAEVTRHEIYPKKQEMKGCGKEGIYINGCAGYGANEKCEWVKQPPGGK